MKHGADSSGDSALPRRASRPRKCKATASNRVSLTPPPKRTKGQSKSRKSTPPAPVSDVSGEDECPLEEDSSTAEVEVTKQVKKAKKRIQKQRQKQPHQQRDSEPLTPETAAYMSRSPTVSASGDAASLATSIQQFANFLQGIAQKMSPSSSGATGGSSRLAAGPNPTPTLDARYLLKLAQALTPGVGTTSIDPHLAPHLSSHSLSRPSLTPFKCPACAFFNGETLSSQRAGAFPGLTFPLCDAHAAQALAVSEGAHF